MRKHPSIVVLTILAALSPRAGGVPGRRGRLWACARAIGDAVGDPRRRHADAAEPGSSDLQVSAW